MTRVAVVMGVSGSGKTTVAERLSAKLGWPFQEGDALHPPANRAKMAAGIPLTDVDRAPWLDAVAAWIAGTLAAGHNGIITCSALKRAYRARIGNGLPGVRIVYLHADRATLLQHVQGRHHEFMPASLLDSQLDTLQEPTPEEHVIEIEVGVDIEETVNAVIRGLEQDDFSLAP